MRQKSDKMRQPNKNRSRKNNRNSNSSNNNKSMGNVTNRVFDSSGPEGKVRGTPSQIVEKYQALARDAQLSGDRVNAENFLQHSEHYARLMADAQRQIDAQNAKREAEQAERAQREAEQAERAAAERAAAEAVEAEAAAAQPEPVQTADEQPNLVETPEQETPKPRRTRSRRSNRTNGGDEAQQAETPAPAAEA